MTPRQNGGNAVGVPNHRSRNPISVEVLQDESWQGFGAVFPSLARRLKSWQRSEKRVTLTATFAAGATLTIRQTQGMETILLDIPKKGRRSELTDFPIIQPLSSSARGTTVMSLHHAVKPGSSPFDGGIAHSRKARHSS